MAFLQNKTIESVLFLWFVPDASAKFQPRKLLGTTRSNKIEKKWMWENRIWEKTARKWSWTTVLRNFLTPSRRRCPEIRSCLEWWWTKEPEVTVPAVLTRNRIRPHSLPSSSPSRRVFKRASLLPSKRVRAVLEIKIIPLPLSIKPDSFSSFQSHLISKII